MERNHILDLENLGLTPIQDVQRPLSFPGGELWAQGYEVACLDGQLMAQVAMTFIRRHLRHKIQINVATLTLAGQKIILHPSEGFVLIDNPPQVKRKGESLFFLLSNSDPLEFGLLIRYAGLCPKDFAISDFSIPAILKFIIIVGGYKLLLKISVEVNKIVLE